MSLIWSAGASGRPNLRNQPHRSSGINVDLPGLAASLFPGTSAEWERTYMARFLVHIHTGPENPTKAALGFLVAATALKEGHQVDIFIAGDGTLLLGKDALSNLEGKGTGKLGAHYQALSEGGVRFYVSGMSAKARGMSDDDLKGKPAEFAMPDVLIRLAAAADVVLTY
jgi:uncharacterized protein